MILGIRGIEESSVYQDIFGKGKAEGRGRGRGRREGRGGAADLAQPGPDGGWADRMNRSWTRIAAIGDLDRLNAPDPSPPRRNHLGRTAGIGR